MSTKNNSKAGFTPSNTAKGNLTGFTLIELLVVIAIIGFLATAAIVALNSARIKARHARRLADLVQITKALDLYADDHGGVYPFGNFESRNSTWSTLLTSYLSPYLSKMPDDPLGTVNGPSIFRFYSYTSGETISAWTGWSSTTGCDNKRMVFSLGDEGGQYRQDCPMPGRAMDTIVIP